MGRQQGPGDVRLRARTGTRAIAAAFAIATLVSLAHAIPAAAQLPPTLEENMDSIVEHQVRGGGVAIPDTGCGAVCSDLYAAEQDESNSAKWALVAGRQTGTKLLPRLLVPVSSLPAGPVVVGGVATFAAGFLIGDSIARKVLHLYPPDQPAPIEYGNVRLDYFKAGNTMASGGFGSIVAPQDGFRLTYSGAGAVWTEWLEPPFSNCPQAVPPPDGLPATAQAVYGSAWADCTWTRPAGFAARAWVEFVPLTVSTVSISDYTGSDPHDGAIEDWPDQPTSKDEVEARLRQLLESDPYLRAWYLSKLDPTDTTIPDCGGLTYIECRDLLEGGGFTVRRTTHDIDEVPDDEIDLGAGAVVQTDPAPGEPADPDDEIEVITNPDRATQLPIVPPKSDHDPDCDFTYSQDFPDSWDLDQPAFPSVAGFFGPGPLGFDENVDGTVKPAVLRYGTTGWGRRHIALGHGWDADAERDTRLTIAFGYRTAQDDVRWTGSRSRTYTALMPHRNVGTKVCGRRVAVQYAYKPQDAGVYPDVNGREKGIITSFGFRPR
jgi:hypothetical protein